MVKSTQEYNLQQTTHMASIYNKLHTEPVLQQITHWASIYEKLHTWPAFTTNYTKGPGQSYNKLHTGPVFTRNYTKGHSLQQITHRAVFTANCIKGQHITPYCIHGQHLQ